MKLSVEYHDLDQIKKSIFFKSIYYIHYMVLYMLYKKIYFIDTYRVSHIL